MKRKIVYCVVGAALTSAMGLMVAQNEPDKKTAEQTERKHMKSELEWKKVLTPEQYYVLREKGTERAFTGKLYNNKEKGIYYCAGCHEPLFSSDTKFNSGTGWPSFWKPYAEGKVEEVVDTSHGMVRTEVVCAACGGHLGHVFEDGPEPTGLRYCINSVSLDFKKDESSQKK